MCIGDRAICAPSQLVEPHAPRAASWTAAVQSVLAWFIYTARMTRRRTLLVTHRARTSTFELTGTLTIGRSQSCDVFIDDQQISRKHAQVHLTDDGVEVEDLGSHNGTLL